MEVDVDEFVAILIVGVGLVYLFKNFENGWRLIMFGAGYLFGKGNPLRKEPSNGGLPRGY